MEKHKAIELAYGSKFSTVFPWVDKNGKFNLRSRKLDEIDDLMKDFTKNDLIQELVNGQVETFIIPKSLKGIEDNNGWISVNDKMPTEIGMYFIINNEGEVTIEIASYNHKVFYRIEFMTNDTITHWQPIIIPSKPIY